MCRFLHKTNFKNHILILIVYAYSRRYLRFGEIRYCPQCLRMSPSPLFPDTLSLFQGFRSTLVSLCSFLMPPERVKYCLLSLISMNLSHMIYVFKIILIYTYLFRLFSSHYVAEICPYLNPECTT